MFKEMRRKDRELINEDIEKILLTGEYGILSTIGNNGYPYCVPLSYVYHDGSIYFHCAHEGYKLQSIKANNKVAFNIVLDTEVLPGKFSTKYESVTIFGRANIVQGEEKEVTLLQLIEKYSKKFIEQGKKYIDNAKDSTTVVKISIDHKTGKGRIN